MDVSSRHGDGKIGRFCTFWPASTNSSKLKTSNNSSPTSSQKQTLSRAQSTIPDMSSIARSFLPSRRRLRLDPSSNLYFPYEPGKQARSAIMLKNTSRFHVAFKFQTTAPKSCYMRPSGAVLSPGQSVVATVYKFVEHPDNEEQGLEQKCNVKFRIMTLKVEAGTDYLPELFDEKKDQVLIERILKVVFIDAERPSPALEKLKHQLAEADAELNSRKKPSHDARRVVGDGLVIDEWKERREKYLARQQDGK